MRILVLRGGALGDLIVTLPALALLRQRWPEARIELVGNGTAGELAVDAGLVDAVHSQHEARWSALYGRTALPAQLARWLHEFDVVVCYWPDPDGELTQRFPSHPGQTALFASSLPDVAPAAAHYCAPLRSLGLIPDNLVYPLRVPLPFGRRVALHPGSGAARKNWPLDRWEALGRWLEADVGVELVIVSGEAERQELLPKMGRRLCNLPLRELADQLAQCVLFIGHDSGISHLAASVGVRCVLLFGPTDPAIWAPPAPNVEVLRRGAEVFALSLGDVQQAVRAALRDRS